MTPTEKALAEAWAAMRLAQTKEWTDPLRNVAEQQLAETRAIIAIRADERAKLAASVAPMTISAHEDAELRTLEAPWPVRMRGEIDALRAALAVERAKRDDNADAGPVPDDQQRWTDDELRLHASEAGWLTRTCAQEALRAREEAARLRRLVETATPWTAAPPLTAEELRALRLRWSSGPERYQADADALIATVLHERERAEKAERERDEARRLHSEAEAQVACRNELRHAVATPTEERDRAREERDAFSHDSLARRTEDLRSKLRDLDRVLGDDDGFGLDAHPCSYREACGVCIRCTELASVLVRDAVAATRWRWPDVPAFGMITFVDGAKVRRKRDPGRCFLRAGFVRIGTTAGGHGRNPLVVLGLPPDAMPAPAAPLDTQLALGGLA